MSEQTTITIPELSDEQRMVIAAQYREEQQKKRLALEFQQGAEEPETERKLYLISFHGNSLALPDNDGRAIHHSCVYAWVEVKKGKKVYIHSAENAQIVASGDGRWFKQPIPLILGGTVVGMAEVSPELLHE